MNYNILRYIITVAEEKNFTRAAEKLFISQPSLSQIIKKEEDRLGFLLFNRTSNPISLTAGGKEYILWAKQILSLFENMERSLYDFSSKDLPILKLGILPECSSFVLPKPLSTFRQNNPNICVKILELSSNDLKLCLENSEVDFIVGLEHSDDYTYHSDLLYEEELILAIGSDSNFLEDRESIDLSKCSNIPFVMMEEGQFLYNVTHDLCKKSGFVPKSVVECYNLETAMYMIKSGVGVSIIPDLMSKLVSGLKCYKIETSTPESKISIVYRNDYCLSKKARELIALIKDNVEDITNKPQYIIS